MKRLLIAIALAAVAAAPAFADQSINVTRTATPDATVHINNIAGSVKIVGWDKNSVQITGHLGSSNQHLKVTGEKDYIDIHVQYPRHSDIDQGTVLVVQLPRGSTVEAHTVSAPIDVQQVVGPQRLKAVSGNVTLESKSQEISAESVSGNVEIKGSAAKAHVEASSVSGDVEIAGISGELDGNSVSGNVTAADSKLQRAKMGSTSGDLMYGGPIESSGVYEFHTTSGDVVLKLSAKPDAKFDIETFSGDIRNDFGPKAEPTRRYGPGQELHFTSGKGSARVRAETLSGDIELRVAD